MTKVNYWKYIGLSFIAFLVLILWNLDAPGEMSTQAWHIFIIFIATIISIMLNVLPIALISIIALTVCIITNLLSIDKALSGFGAPIAWLVVIAFFIARSLIKSGLGARIAYYLISKFGKSTLGLSYSIVLTEFFLAPAVPSASARGGGIIFPVVQSLIKSYSQSDVHSHTTHHNIATTGSNTVSKFLVMICLHANVITSTMFLTAVASNPIVVKLAASYGIYINWWKWALGAIVPGILSLIFLPIILYMLCKPSIASRSHIIQEAKAMLAKMGPLKSCELYTLIVFIALITMWTLEPYLHLSATTAAMVGLVALLIMQVLSWEDVINERSAWDTFIWFGILMTLAGALNDLGVTKWMVNNIAWFYDNNHNVNRCVLICILYVVFFYGHYFFASVTVYITVMYATFLGILINLGIQPLPAALSLAYISVLSAGLTHYGIASAPILFGAGHVSVPAWWKISSIVATLNLVIWVVSGVIWWKILGWI